MRLNNKGAMAALALVGCVAAGAQTRSRPSTGSAMSSPAMAADATRDGPPPSTGPNATSDRGAERFDQVGYAAVMGGNGYIAMLPGLAPGEYVEVTALDSGRSTLALVTPGDAPAGTLVVLSSTAADAIGLADQAPVRIRRVTPSPADRVALANGGSPGVRLPAPRSLLDGLRAQLTPRPMPKPSPARPTRTMAARPIPSVPAKAIAKPVPARPVGSAIPTGTTGYYVQVAAFGSADRATTLARSLGGSVAPLGSLYRVRLGPYATPAAAAQARATAAARGYRDARIVQDR